MSGTNVDSDSDGRGMSERPDTTSLTLSDYSPAALGGVGAYVAGLLTTYLTLFQSTGSFKFAEQAVFYAWLHAIVPFQTNAEQYDGVSGVDEAGLAALFIVYIFGFVIILVSVVSGSRMKQSFGRDAIDKRTFTGVFAGAYSLCLFLTASQFTIVDSVPALLLETGGSTLTISVDPVLSLVAGLLIAGVFGFYGAQYSVGNAKENMEKTFGDVDGMTTNPRKVLFLLGGIWLLLVVAIGSIV